MSYSRQWFENVQMHMRTFTMAHSELMNLCITLNGFEYNIFTFASNLCIFLYTMVYKNERGV